MGDKEESIAAGDEEEEEMKMLLHCSPIYPLPEAIKKMDHNETVCRYCGISYLLFHEFHQLRTQLAQLEAMHQELRETAQKEKAQHEALQLDRLEWERALRLQVQEETEVREKRTREDLEEMSRGTARALREEFEAKFESQRSKVEKEFQKICEETETRLRGELGDLAVEKLRNQREELERRVGERETVLSEALQKANKNLEELRKNRLELEERLAITTAMKDDAEQGLCKEKQHVKTLRGACVKQQQALRATLSFLKFSGRVLADVRGFLSQLMGTWQALRSQMLQQSTQVFSALSEELQHSTVKLQKEKEHLTQQLMEQKGQRDEQLFQQENSEKEHRKNFHRLKGELEEKNERWLLCQQRCDAMQKQLSSWEQRQKQLNQDYSAAVEEVTQMRKALETIQREKRELTRERYVLIESHSDAMTKMKEDYRQQLAKKLAATLEEHRSQSAFLQSEQKEELCREAELELEKERENSKMLLLKCQQENSQLQQKLEEKVQDVQDLHERGSREEERRKQDKQRKTREEEICQQEAQELSQAKAELELMTVKNAELMEEVALLQETVRRECEEREELTAALSRAQQELFERQSEPSHRSSFRPLPGPMRRQTPPGNKNFHLHSQTRVPLTRSSTSPNTVWPSPACTDKDRDLDQDGEGAGRSLESWSSNGVFGGEKRQKGTLPRLKASNKVSWLMGRKEKQ